MRFGGDFCFAPQPLTKVPQGAGPSYFRASAGGLSLHSGREVVPGEVCDVSAALAGARFVSYC